MAWIWHYCGCGVAAIALIRLLAWEHPYAVGEALKRKKDEKDKKKKVSIIVGNKYYS